MQVESCCRCLFVCLFFFYQTYCFLAVLVAVAVVVAQAP